MSVKYLSLSLVAAAIAVSVGGVVMVASKAGGLLKQPNFPPANFVVPQLKPERFTESSDLDLALNAYKKRLATPAVSADRQIAALAALDGQRQPQFPGSANQGQLFAGADVRTPGLAVGGTPQIALQAGSERQNNQVVAGAKPPFKSRLDTVATLRAPATTIELPKVSVVVINGTTNKAVINGSMVAVNSQLYGGYVVKEINIDSVVLMNGREEFIVRIPLERLRVLGAPEAFKAKGV